MFFRDIMARTSYIFDGGMRMMFALYYINKISWIFIMLAHWNNSAWVDMSLHSYTLPWLRVNQSVLFLLNGVCLEEKQQMLILQSLVWPGGGSNPRFTALEALYHYTTDAVNQTMTGVLDECHHVHHELLKYNLHLRKTNFNIDMTNVIRI